MFIFAATAPWRLKTRPFTLPPGGGSGGCLSRRGSHKSCRCMNACRKKTTNTQIPTSAHIQPFSKKQAWMYWAFNKDRRSFMAAFDGKTEFVYHTH